MEEIFKYNQEKSIKEFTKEYPNGATLLEFECLNWEPGGGLGEDERFVVQSDLDVKLINGEYVLLDGK